MKELIKELEVMKELRWKGIKAFKKPLTPKAKEKLDYYKRLHKQLCCAIKILSDPGKQHRYMNTPTQTKRFSVIPDML